MQKEERHTRSDGSLRNTIFTLKSGFFVEISWHAGNHKWSGEFFKDAMNSKDVIHGQVFSKRRRDIPKMLRLAIAEELNPAIRNIRHRLQGWGWREVSPQVGQSLVGEFHNKLPLVKEWSQRRKK